MLEERPLTEAAPRIRKVDMGASPLPYKPERGAQTHQ